LNGEGEGDKRYEALLLQSFVHQLTETEKVFSLYVKKEWVQLTPYVSEGVADIHLEIRRRFLELRELKVELKGPAASDTGLLAWQPQHARLVAHLRRRVTSLQEQIWCYSESGDYASEDPCIDVPALVARMKELKVIPDKDEVEEDEEGDAAAQSLQFRHANDSLTDNRQEAAWQLPFPVT